MQKTLAIILKKQNIGETDRILTIFSPVFGKKRVIVRAVRKPLSKLAGHLDTFMVSQLMLTEEVDLPKVTSAVLIEAFEAIRGSYAQTEKAFAISRIVERVILEDISQQSIFQLTLDALVRLNDSQDWTHVWLVFLSTLIARLGLLTNDFNCPVCHQPITAAASWSADNRSLTCANCKADGGKQLQANSIKLLKLLQKKTYATIRQIVIPDSVAREVEELFLKEVTRWFNRPWESYATLAGGDI